MSYKTVCVAGGGVLGSQIAFQAAYCGFDVTIWLRREGSIGRTQPKIDHVREEYIAAIAGMALFSPPITPASATARSGVAMTVMSDVSSRSPPSSVPTPHSS